jgi:hypothetical protein
MTPTVSAVTHDRQLSEQLDQLIPPPLPRAKKLLVGAVVLALAASVTVLNIGGYLVPAPFKGASFGSTSYLEVDAARGLVAARVMIPNYSERTVRVTAVTLEAPGAELVDAEVVIEADDAGLTGADGSFAAEVETDPSYLGSHDRLALPASIGAGQRAFLVLWFRPVSCLDAGVPWGIAEATVDFGEGAFPPFSNTVRIDEDPIWEDGEPVQALIGNEFISGTGPLALACEALQ